MSMNAPSSLITFWTDFLQWPPSVRMVKTESRAGFNGSNGHAGNPQITDIDKQRLIDAPAVQAPRTPLTFMFGTGPRSVFSFIWSSKEN